MKNERLIEGLNMIIEGATILRNELSGAEVSESKGAESKSVARRAAVQKEEPVMNAPEEKEAGAEVEGTLSREQLMSMKFNDLKKLGASLGVSCSGKRDEIIDRILNVSVKASVEPEESEDEGTVEKGKVVPISKKKGGLKKKKEEPEEDTAEEEEAGPSEESIKLAEELTEDMSAKEIIDYLAECGIKAKGKKSDVILVLAKGIEDGTVELEDDEEDTEDEEEAEESVDEGEEEVSSDEEEGEEFNEESYFPEYDEAGYNNPDSMKEERAEAVKAMMADIIEKVENDELKEEDMQTFLENVCTDEELEALGEDYEFEELVALYCEIRKRFVDDDGEEHEPGDPYELNEKNFCCGHELKYEKKSKTFICESCGEKYTAE